MIVSINLVSARERGLNDDAVGKIIEAGTSFGEAYGPAALQPGADQHP
ncbi:MAG: hypothetical protein JJ897_17540 [Marinibacterium sp.]|nr:hypothetical protein [Marinibacterium sp.]